MQYLHTMVRVSALDASLKFYCKALGLAELRRYAHEQGRFTLVFLSAPGNESAQVELTYNWDPEGYSGGRNFGHLAYQVDDIYATCERLVSNDGVINRPPRDGRGAHGGGQSDGHSPRAALAARVARETGGRRACRCAYKCQKRMSKKHARAAGDAPGVEEGIPDVGASPVSPHIHQKHAELSSRLAFLAASVESSAPADVADYC